MARFRKNDFFKWAQKIKSVFCFIPHTHEGCDLNNLSSSAAQFSFNPHTHEGCDIALVLVAFMMIGFNPHTHEGCDYWEQKTNQRLKFQSTHPRRV